MGESFLKESKTEMADKDKGKFEQLNRIVSGQAIDVDAALHWAMQNQTKLADSGLVFKLHKVKYLGLLTEAVHIWQKILD